ncbi:hypothetical protein KEM52_002898 [Ascosphaera acerosa]|nr:hypothetical protein KEM52_002898 [Ascosphaera acerosa]
MAGLNYGFVEYDDPGAAERAMHNLNGRRVHQSVSITPPPPPHERTTTDNRRAAQEIRVNWAYQSNTANKEDTSAHFHIFVGDLSNDVNDEVLLQAFAPFGSCSEARVMWDMKTGRSRGYGFVAFRERADAEKALSAMDGEWLGSRAIRCNWANQKGNSSTAYKHHHQQLQQQQQQQQQQQAAMAAMGINPVLPAPMAGMGMGMGMVPGMPMGMGMAPGVPMGMGLGGGMGVGMIPSVSGSAAGTPPPMVAPAAAAYTGGGRPHHHFPTHGLASYDMVVAQTPAWQTTCYVGNLTPYTTQNDLVPLFQSFGYVVETRMQADRGFAFVKMDTHENAAVAICQLNGYTVNGRPLKCSVRHPSPCPSHYRQSADQSTRVLAVGERPGPASAGAVRQQLLRAPSRRRSSCSGRGRCCRLRAAQRLLR